MKSPLTLVSILFGLMTASVLAADHSVFQIRLVKDGAGEDTERASLTITSPDGKSSATEVLHLQKKVLLDGSAIQSAKATKNEQTGGAQLELHCNQQGKEALAAITAQNIGQRLAFLVEGKVLTAPRISGAINAGAAVISGSFTEDEAKELARKIMAAVKQ